MSSAETRTAEESVAIIRKTLAACKPSLKHLPGFEPIRDILNEVIDLGFHGYWEWVTDDRVVDSPWGVDLDECCVIIANVGPETDSAPAAESVEGEGLEYQTRILLLQDGTLIEQRTRYYAVNIRPPTGRGDNRTRNVVLSCQLNVLDRDYDLQILLERDWARNLAEILIKSLSALMTRGIAEGDEAIKKMEQSRSFLQSIQSEIKE